MPTSLILRCFLTAAFLLILSAGRAFACQETDPNHPGTWLVKLDSGRRYAGRVEAASDRSTMVLTRRNGRLAFIESKEIESKKQVDLQYAPKTFDQMEKSLKKEFGAKYRVSRTQHFLVVYPVDGNHQTWALPFEELFLRFKGYFRSRGLTISQPEFPLVAVVLNSRKEFDRMLAQAKMPGSSNVVGYYSLKSNRLFTYKFQTRWKNEKQNIADTMETLVHEAVHQCAFNCGVHSRIFRNPRWSSEGLATFFEAPGVNNYFKFPDQKSRINWGRLAALRRYYEKTDAMKGQLAQMVSNDNIFRSDPSLAYALAWGLTSYLAERNPHRYVQYLEKLKRFESTASSTRSKRIRHFEDSFGSIESVENGLRSYIESLPKKK